MKSLTRLLGFASILMLAMGIGGCSKSLSFPISPLLSSTSGATPVATPIPTVASDEICFSGPGGGGNMPLYKVHPDGTGLNQVAPSSLKTFHPGWSPDKSKIVFDGYSSTSASRLYIINADGTGLTQVASQGGTPAWSPDGTRIAFISGAGQVWVMNLDGSNQHQLTNNPSDTAGPDDIAWSPDSTKLVFNTSSGTKIMNADGTGLQGFPVLMKYIDWSPNGNQFVFAAFTGMLGTTNYWQVFTVNVDGTGLTQLTNTPSSHGGPCWSQNGAKIVFTDILGNGAMYTMNPDGSGVSIISNAWIYYCYQPCWH